MYVGKAEAPAYKQARQHEGGIRRRSGWRLWLATLILLAGCSPRAPHVELDPGPSFAPIPQRQIAPELTSVFEACMADGSLSPGVEQLVGDSFESVSEAMETGHLAVSIVDGHSTPQVHIISEHMAPFVDVPMLNTSQNMGTTAQEFTHAHILLQQLEQGATLDEIGGANTAQYEREEPMVDFLTQDVAACAERQGVPRNQNEDAWFFSTFGYKPIEVQQAFVKAGATETSPVYAAMFWLGMGLGREHRLKEAQVELWGIEQQLAKTPNDGSLLAKQQQYDAWISSLYATSVRDQQYAEDAYDRGTPEEQAMFQQILKEHEALFSQGYLAQAERVFGGR